jgi:glycolate oxidase
MDAMYRKAKEFGGLVSGEHGIGHAKTEYFGQSLSEPEIRAMKKIKQALDPKGIMNPGKVFSSV